MHLLDAKLIDVFHYWIFIFINLVLQLYTIVWVQLHLQRCDVFSKKFCGQVVIRAVLSSMKTRMNSCLSYINSFSNTLMSFANMEERMKLSWVSEFYVLCDCVSFININEDRYDPKMSPAIPEEKWRKGSQVLYLPLKFSYLYLCFQFSL